MTKEEFLDKTIKYRERVRASISTAEGLIKSIEEHDRHFASLYSQMCSIERELLEYLDKRVEGK